MKEAQCKVRYGDLLLSPFQNDDSSEKWRTECLQRSLWASLHCWWECKLVQPLWRMEWKLLKKLKIELPCNPATPLLGLYPAKNTVWKDTCTPPMFIAVLFTTARTWTGSKCPSTDEWVKRMLYIYTEEYYSPLKRMKCCRSQQHAWAWNYHTKWHKPDKDWYMISLIWES